MNMKKTSVFLTLILAIVFMVSCADENLYDTDYSKSESWAYLETETEKREADVFFICPTVYSGDKDSYNMPADDKSAKEKFVGAVNMEKGIYQKECRFFAPYYSQVGLNVYEMDEKSREPYLEIAYADIADAFRYYLKYYNEGRPIVLAGFSQGADMCIRLMKEYSDSSVMERIVACYAIGWRVTDEDLRKYPKMKMAEGELDTGVIVSFNSEDPKVTDSLMIPKGEKTYAINPLNWKTDGTLADKSLNLGACFTDYSGKINSEKKEFTGAYIDDTRGALKVTDVSYDEYSTDTVLFDRGVYHIYDYMFFYRNLQKNVGDRIDAYVLEN